jgi:hypothetical protein
MPDAAQEIEDPLPVCLIGGSGAILREHEVVRAFDHP